VESENVEQNLKLIKKYAIKAGIAINPETKVEMPLYNFSLFHH